MEHLQPEKRRWNKCNWAQISNSQQELKWASSARNSDGRKSFLDRKNSFLDREGSLDKWDGNSSTRAPATHLPPDAQVNYTNEFERQIQHFFKWLETVFIQSTQCHQSLEIDEERFDLYFSQKKTCYIFFPYHDKWSGWKVGASNQSSSTVFFL